MAHKQWSLMQIEKTLLNVVSLFMYPVLGFFLRSIIIIIIFTSAILFPSPNLGNSTGLIGEEAGYVEGRTWTFDSEDLCRNLSFIIS